MGRKIVGREKAVEALAALCDDYRGTALRAIRKGGESVFIPITPDHNTIMTMRNPNGLYEFASQNENQGREPVYSSADELRAGRNADGTPHAGYAKIDVVAKLVTDICTRDGTSVVPRIRPLDAGLLMEELGGRKQTYCL